MVRVNINSFEIAKLFGLTGPSLDTSANPLHEDDYSFYFHIHGQEIVVKYGMGDGDAVDEDEAKEEAATRLLNAIGIMVAGVIKL